MWFRGKDPAVCRAGWSSSLPGWKSSDKQSPVLDAPLPGIDSLCAAQKPGSPGEIHSKNTLSLFFSGLCLFAVIEQKLYTQVAKNVLHSNLAYVILSVIVASVVTCHLFVLYQRLS